MNAALFRSPKSAVTCLVAAALVCAAAVAYAGGQIYWTDPGNGTIHRAHLHDGSGVEDVITRVQPVYFAVDGAGQTLYWSDAGSGQIKKRGIFTGVEEVLLTIPTYGIAIDDGASKLYIANGDAGKVQRANLDGTGFEDLITGLSDPWGIDLDVAGGKMYWCDSDDGTILRANLDGSGMETLVTGLQIPNSVRLHVAGGKMYWCDLFEDKIRRANLDGSSQEDVHTGFFVGGIGIDTTAGKLYWTEPYSQRLRRSDLSGANIEQLVDTTPHSHPFALAVDNAVGKVYWTDNLLFGVRRAELDGTNVQTIVQGFNNAGGGVALDLNSEGMYWADTGQQAIIRVRFDGRGARLVVADPIGVPIVVAVDTVGDRIYWTNDSEDVIKSAEFDGSDVQAVVEGYSPLVFALDAVARHLYFTDLTGMICRATEGNQDIDTLISGLGFVAPLALDTPNGKMYWADVTAGSIWRADLDGSNGEQLLSGRTDPYSIALDVAAGYMYFSEFFRGVIVRAELDGTNPTDFLTTSGFAGYIALVPDPDVPTMLQSYAAAPSAEGVEITWRLAELGMNPEFFVLRRDGDSADAPYGELRDAVVTGAGLAYRVLDTSCRPGMTYRYRIDVSDEDGRRTLFETGDVTVPAQTVELHQNHPNPFNPSTVISFVLPERAHATLSVYRADGALVRTLVDGPLDGGLREFSWDGMDAGGSRVGSGVYFYRLRTGKTTLTRKMVLLK